MLTKILIGLVVTVFAIGVVDGVIMRIKLNRTNSQLVAAQEQNLKLEIENQAKDATINFLSKKKEVKARVKRETDEIEKAVDTGDAARIRKLYDNYRVQPQPGPTPGSR